MFEKTDSERAGDFAERQDETLVCSFQDDLFSLYHMAHGFEKRLKACPPSDLKLIKHYPQVYWKHNGTNCRDCFPNVSSMWLTKKNPQRVWLTNTFLLGWSLWRTCTISRDLCSPDSPDRSGTVWWPHSSQRSLCWDLRGRKATQTQDHFPKWSRCLPHPLHVSMDGVWGCSGGLWGSQRGLEVKANVTEFWNMLGH